MMKKILLFSAILFCSTAVVAQPWSERLAATFLNTHRDSILIGERKTARWDYEQGLMLEALKRLWMRTGELRYFQYIRQEIDQFVKSDGSIRTYKLADYNLDNLATGRTLLLLYEETKKDQYKKAANLLRQQLREQPRTPAGGFWHKKRYPEQMWLDGLYMAQPFYAAYGQFFAETANFDDVAQQFTLIEKNALDPQTGLLYHGYDASRKEAWAHPQTGCSPNFWGRSLGWYAMALVDVLDYFPTDHPQRSAILGYFQRLAPTLARYQDTSGCWWQILDQGGRAGNYLEASVSGMLVYALAKGVRLGYLPNSYAAIAERGFAGMLKQFISLDSSQQVHLEKTVSVGGLGGNPYRDGSYAYYLSEPLRRDDLKGMGPFILAALEIENLQTPKVGRNKIVLLDYFFNNETRKGLNGLIQRYHYIWEDRMDSGFSWWGEVLQQYGARLAALPQAPTNENLAAASVYIIVDPDTKKETASPNFIQPEQVEAIRRWVKKGGILLMMANDTGACELNHFQQLASAFGLGFTDQNRNMVKNNVYTQGLVEVTQPHPIFSDIHQLFLKEIVTLQPVPDAQVLLQVGTEPVMLTKPYGKGRVVLSGDPWLYNEYVNAKRLPAEYQNFRAMHQFSAWLLEQARPNPAKKNRP